MLLVMYIERLMFLKKVSMPHVLYWLGTAQGMTHSDDRTSAQTALALLRAWILSESSLRKASRPRFFLHLLHFSQKIIGKMEISGD